MKRNSFRAITDHEALRAEEIGRVGQGSLAAMTSWQVVKMALIGATTALVAATIIAPAVTTPAAAAEITRRPQANGLDAITIRGDIEADDHKKFIDIAVDPCRQVSSSIPKEDTSKQP